MRNLNHCASGKPIDLVSSRRFSSGERNKTTYVEDEDEEKEDEEESREVRKKRLLGGIVLSFVTDSLVGGWRLNRYQFLTLGSNNGWGGLSQAKSQLQLSHSTRSEWSHLRPPATPPGGCTGPGMRQGPLHHFSS